MKSICDPEFGVQGEQQWESARVFGDKAFDGTGNAPTSNQARIGSLPSGYGFMRRMMKKTTESRATERLILTRGEDEMVPRRINDA